MELYTIIAQLINFIVLIFILNKILYKPVLKTMEKRKKEIQDKIDETERKLEETEKIKEDYFNKLQEVEKENVILREQAVEEIKKFKELELQKAREDLESKRNKFKDHLLLEQKNLVENFNDNFLELFIKYSNNIFNTLSNSNLQKEIINTFLEKINNLDKNKIDSINSLNPEVIYITSNNNLTDENKKIIEDFLNSKGFKFKKINFDINEKLILGIELKIESYVFSWDVRELTNNFILDMKKMK